MIRYISIDNKAYGWLLVSFVILCISLAVHVVPLTTGHIFDNVDLRTHYQWATQFYQVLTEGTWFPRWMPMANDGLGEPSFIIIHPGYYYFISLLRMLGFDVWMSMRLAAFISTLFMGYIAYISLYKEIGPHKSLFTALLLQVMPFAAFLYGYHAALPWHFSLPLVLLVILFSMQGDKSNRINIKLSVSVGFLCVTHLLVAFMVLLCLSMYQALQLVSSRDERIRKGVLTWAVSVALGLGLSSFYWILALTSLPLFNAETRVVNQYLDWRNSFVFPLFTSGIYGTRWAFVQWVLPIIPLAILTISFFIDKANKYIDETASLSLTRKLWWVGLIALLLSSELSYPLYAYVSFLRNVQWPYRFLTVAYVASIMSIGMLGFSVIRGRRISSQKVLVLILVAFICTLTILIQYKQYVEGVSPMLESKAMLGHVGQKGAEPALIGPDWKEYVQNGSMQGYCERVRVQCENLLSYSHHRIWSVTSGNMENTEIIFPIFTFPAWVVAVDDAIVIPSYDVATGLIKLAIPNGKHIISIQWKMLWQEQVGFTLSVFSLIICCYLAAKSINSLVQYK